MSRNYAVPTVAFSGQGDIMMAVRNADGTPGGFTPIGNLSLFEINLAVESATLNESYSGQRLPIASITTSVSVEIKANFNSFNKEVLDIGTRGETTVVPAATSVAWSATAYKGKIVGTGFLNVSALTVTTPGASATAFAATTAVALGDYIKPAVSNGRYYKVTAAGTTAAAEPVWPTDGSTVTSGTATLKDMGVIAPVLGTDYSVNAEWGTLNILSTGGIVDESPISGTLSHGALEKTHAFVEAEPRRWIRFNGINTAQPGSPPVQVDVYDVGIKPMSALSLISDEFGNTEITMNAYADQTKLGSGVSQFFDIKMAK